ncbi:MAG: hypothetical protein ACMG6S_21930, partial [Byssovorax sp.]
MTNRRDVWRDFMGRFEPSADPRDAVERGFYVPRPGRSLAEQLAARFELKPGASHILMGGVGSGKTTQLLVARDRLVANADVNATYLDVSLHVEPNQVTSTALLAMVGLTLGSQIYGDDISSEIKEALNQFESYLASSGENWYEDPFDTFAQDIGTILNTLRKIRPNHVLLLDSLDRMTDLKRFADLVEGSIIKLRELGIGIILIGPLTALYGIRRTALDRFDRTWHLPTVDVQNDAAGHDFLLRVLRARDVEGLLTDAAAAQLCTFSGGVLRDLIALTQAAGEEAYVDGADRVEAHHVELAAEIFGRKH